MTDSLLNRIKRTSRLPSPPGTALQILRLCQKDEVVIEELADTIAADPALSLRMLKYANSAMIAANKEVTSIREAVLLLGLRSVRLMALSFSLVSTEDAKACQGFDFGLFWSHSVARAVAARSICESQTAPPAPEEAFATALLSQVGRLVFAVSMREEYVHVIEACGGMLMQASEIETRQMGSSQEELGAELILEWGIPDQLAEAIRHQNNPEELADNIPGLRKLAKIVQVSTIIGSLVCYDLPEATRDEYWKRVFDSGFFASPKQAEDQVKSIRKEFKEISSVLSLKHGAASNAAEIQAEAGEVLDELNLANQLTTQAVLQENAGLQKAAWIDALTGINNRAAFDKQSDEIWKACCNEHKPFAMIMVDVDRFKLFNDTHGHQTGDIVLQAVAGALKSAVRKTDFPARYGGEEFAIIAPHADRLTAAHVCVKIRKAVEMATILHEGKKHKVTVSVGCALLLDPKAPYTPAKLIEEADKQLYIAKEKGRNCCSMAQLPAVPREAGVPAVAAT